MQATSGKYVILEYEKTGKEVAQVHGWFDSNTEALEFGKANLERPFTSMPVSVAMNVKDAYDWLLRSQEVS